MIQQVCAFFRDVAATVPAVAVHCVYCHVLGYPIKNCFSVAKIKLKIDMVFPCVHVMYEDLQEVGLLHS